MDADTAIAFARTAFVRTGSRSMDEVKANSDHMDADTAIAFARTGPKSMDEVETTSDHTDADVGWTVVDPNGDVRRVSRGLNIDESR